MSSVKLTELVAPSFYAVHQDIKAGIHTHYWLNGGRGSTKSSFVSIEIVLGMMADPQANAVCMRKVGLYLKESVYEQLVWAIEKLGVSHLWEERLSPLGLIYRPTGQRILFRGADKPKKIKSTKVSKGYIKYLWYEELDEFDGMEEIRTINQSLIRGGDRFFVFYSYNPPKSGRNWVNAETLTKRDDRLIHQSTYLTVPPQWLGQQFLIEAEHLKAAKPEAYKHEYLGEITGTGGEIFTNLQIREISDDEIKLFDRIKRGLDFGYAVDPLHYTVCHHNKGKRRLYIFGELHKVALSTNEAVRLIKAENKLNQRITADSEEPRTIATMKGMGLNIIGAKKGPDSVEHGIKYLQDLEAIIIDPVRCPNTAREFSGYEYEADKEGGFKADYPDKNNHSIDGVRYAIEDDIIRRGVRLG